MEMKKLIAVASVIFLCGWSTFAVYQYSPVSSVANDIGNSSVGVVVNGGSFQGMLQNTMYFNQNLYVLASFSVGNVADLSSFGVYTIGNGAMGVQYEFAQVAGSDYFTAIDANGNPIKFEAGTELGIWMSQDNKTVYSTPGVAGGGTHADRDILNGDTYVAGFFGGLNGSSLYPGGAPGISLDVNFTSTQPPVAGQPLPGIIASLAAIGAGGFFRKRFLRK